MTKAINKLKEILGENYDIKIELAAKNGDMYDVLQQCTSCNQLMFYHPEGACTRSDSENKIIFDEKSLDELKISLNGDIKKKIKDLGSMDTLMKLMDNQQKFFEKMFANNSGVCSKNAIQITNVKQPPVWKKQNFIDYKEQVLNWKNHNTGDDYAQYQDFINELQKNNNIKGLEEYMSTIVIPMTKSSQNVDSVLKYLEEKYEITEWEKFGNLIDSMDFKVDKSLGAESVLSKIDKIITEVKSLKLNNKINYFMTILVIKRLKEQDFITEIEHLKLKEEIEGKNEDEVQQTFKKYFKKIKIEGKRNTLLSTDGKLSTTMYVNGRSRYDSWKNSRDFKNWKRTPSGNGWKTRSELGLFPEWKKALSKSRDRQLSNRSRSNSQNFGGRSYSFGKNDQNFRPRSKSNTEFNLKELVLEMKKDIDMIKKTLEKGVVSTKFVQDLDFEDNDWSNVKIYFTQETDEINELVLDSGAPKTLVGLKHLHKYLEHNGLHLQDLETSSCKQRFKFGSGDIYVSEKKVFVPVVLKGQNSTVPKKIEAYVIDASIPFLIGLDFQEPMDLSISMDSRKI